jgi:polyhydroxybutyrate depolymerase
VHVRACARARSSSRAFACAFACACAAIAGAGAGCDDHVGAGPGSDAPTGDARIGDGDPGDGPGFDASSGLGSRPYDLYVPTGYRAGTPTPLVLMLHGYSASADLQEIYFRLEPEAEAHGFLYARANGTIDGLGNRFWNATDACCNLGHAAVDDVAYLRAVLDDVAARYTVDPKRVFVVGHSNGGFMSHRLACDLSDRVAAIVSFAGATFADASRCQPSRPVAVAEIHGTADLVIAYNGGRVVGADGPYPAAITTAAIWRAKNHCTGTTSGGRLDLLADVLGNETRVERATGCDAGGGVELWTMDGGGHVSPLVQPAFRDAVWAFFSSHPRP